MGRHAFCSGSSRPRGRIRGSCFGSQILYLEALHLLVAPVKDVGRAALAGDPEAEDRDAGAIREQGLMLPWSPRPAVSLVLPGPARAAMWKQCGVVGGSWQFFKCRFFFFLNFVYQYTSQAAVYLKLGAQLFKITFGYFKSRLKWPWKPDE